MMSLRSILSIIIISIAWSCNSGEIRETLGTGDFSDYILSPIPDTDYHIAEKRDAGGVILENGILNGGLKDGSWATYYADERKHVKSLTTYVKGVKNGIHLEFNNRGQVEKRESFINDQLHGMSAVYKLGRPSTTTEYKYGMFHGQHIEYYNSGKIQKLVEFKNGKQDGLLRYYDEEGTITLEYIYKDGEKVSGGIIE